MPAFTPAPDHALHAFEAFASHYDDFSAHHDYEAWVCQLLGLAEAHGLDGRRLLDVACGTGKSLMPFVERGFTVTACDQSAAMLEVARAKARSDVRFVRCDVRSLPDLGAFDLITVLGDIVNYLVEAPELIDMFGGIRRNLAPDGLVVFDANTLWMYSHLWADHPQVALDDGRLTWQCQTGPGLAPGGLAVARVLVERATSDERIADHLHFQRHHPEKVVRDALAVSGLTPLAVYGQFPDGRWEHGLAETRHSKGIYIASLARPAAHAKEVN